MVIYHSYVTVYQRVTQQQKIVFLGRFFLGYDTASMKFRFLDRNLKDLGKL